MTLALCRQRYRVRFAIGFPDRITFRIVFNFCSRVEVWNWLGAGNGPLSCGPYLPYDDWTAILEENTVR